VRSRQQRPGLPALQIDQHRPIGLAFPQGEVIYPEDRRGGERWRRVPAQQPQERVSAYPQVPGVAEAYPSPPTQRDAEREEALRQPESAPGPGRSDRGEPFSEDAARAVAITAEPLAHAELQPHMIVCPGQIGEDPFVVAVDARRQSRAHRTGCIGLGRAHDESDLARGVIERTCFEAQQCGIG
jgi:hypothetical protein